MRFMTKPGIAIVCGALAIAGLASAPARSAEPGFTSSQKDEIRKVVRDYLLKNPEVIMEAIQALRRKQQEEQDRAARVALAKHRDELFKAGEGDIAGNPKGDITIIEFMDYRCGYCKAAKATLDAVVKQDGNIRVIYKEFPILGPVSTYASRAALASRKQGKYIAYHDALMGYEGNLTPGKVLDLAEKVGLDVDKLKKDMGSKEVSDIIERNHAIAREMGIRGTPAFILGNELIPGAVNADSLKQKITAARQYCKSSKTPTC